MIAWEPFVHDGLFNGSGRIEVWDLLQGARLEPFQEVLACQLEVGGRVGAHVQAEFPELLLVTSGQGEVRLDGHPSSVQGGSLVLVPLGCALEIENLGAEPLQYYIIKASAR